MSASGLLVEKSGPLSLIQDFGRFGLAHIGITQGGPVDDYAYSWANHLLGNRVNCSAIEITLGNACFVALQDCHLAICGGDLNASVDGHPIANWSDFSIKKGQKLQFGIAKNGLRAYLAVKGGFNVPEHLGSSSTVLREALGGLEANGNALKAGDVLPFDTHSLPNHKPRIMTFRFKPDYNLPITLRVIEGYQCDDFSVESKEKFYSGSFAISPDSNRMGYRLEGNTVKPPYDGILSEGIALGAIQIPHDGNPIVLLNDHQTIGGYPKLGCVARIDLPRLAQAKPGQKVRFVKGDRQGLQDVWCQWAQFFGY
ncbi:TPA: 5-oxoprolinase/urea amidolyase family protein [Vibrio parahaemolyticus]|uniref:5-oxoprolinase subunit C family protein n=1 Tax=Vibrio parahaemolyticus TaxID=670 RepID=UPI00063EBAA8|nr:biotin-dependent carboxyltransferase family protein [Vibrio parahaemolyticus]KLI84369.1 allophanate hydrolase [Vibrio parahaemolyticus]TON93472.1 allophanate hydrolase [Vibrio parahaemolyticus]HAS6546588.1 5-oxoprolinase/urea amidolyase family protein [Vibrio parahaemolyticus]HAS6734662.1 5-oxoprolinase/urea amidolyase family protein [Vibrio parahaemolyticus]HAS6848894.1 5-oxoprolinase/urea amidolyase family protein [Vibrio parahaemolyticus]